MNESGVLGSVRLSRHHGRRLRLASAGQTPAEPREMLEWVVDFGEEGIRGYRTHIVEARDGKHFASGIVVTLDEVRRCDDEQLRALIVAKTEAAVLALDDRIAQEALTTGGDVVS